MPTKRTMAHVTKYDIDAFASRATRQFIESGMPLDESIAKIAVDNGLNREQVRRIVQSANVLANTALVKQARASKSDPRIHFKMASDTGVFERITAGHPMAKAAHDQRRSDFSSMFTIPAKSDAPDMEKAAREDPLEPRPVYSELKPSDIAAAYLGMSKVAISADEIVTPGVLELAVADLEQIDSVATAEVSGAKNRIANTEDEIRRLVSDQIRSGVSPATVKLAVMSSARGAHEGSVSRTMSILEEQAAAIPGAAGAADFEYGDIIDPRHPLMFSMSKLGGEMRELVKAENAQKKVRAAKSAAKKDSKAARASGACKVAFVQGLMGAARAAPSVVGMAAKYSPMANALTGGAIPGLGRFSRSMKPVRAAMTAGSLADRALTMGATAAPKRTPAVGPVKIASFGEGAERVLGGPGSNLSTLAGAVVATAAISAGAKALDAGVSRVSEKITGVFEKARRRKIFAEIAASNPKLATDPRAAEYFDLVMTYAPSLANNKTAITDYLVRLLEFPRSSVELVQSLINLESSYRGAFRHDTSDDFSRSVQNVVLTSGKGAKKNKSGKGPVRP